MDECNPNRSGTKRKRLGKKVILVVIAAILTHSLVLASIAAPLYLQAPAFLMERGDYAKAYQIALKSEKNSILAESTMVEVIRKFSGYLYHPSSFELLGGIYILEQDVKGQAHMSVSFKYRALNKSGIDKSIGWQEVWPVKCGDVDILPAKFHEDKNGRSYNYDMECASEGKFNCTKMTKGQLTRINKRVANETLGNISPVPAEMIDCSLIPESEFKSIITGYKSNGTD